MLNARLTELENLLLTGGIHRYQPGKPQNPANVWRVSQVSCERLVAMTGSGFITVNVLFQVYFAQGHNADFDTLLQLIRKGVFTGIYANPMIRNTEYIQPMQDEGLSVFFSADFKITISEV